MAQIFPGKKQHEICDLKYKNFLALYNLDVSGSELINKS